MDLPLSNLKWLTCHKIKSNQTKSCKIWLNLTKTRTLNSKMHIRQNQFNHSGIKWPTEVDMLFNKTQTQRSDVCKFLLIGQHWQARVLKSMCKSPFASKIVCLVSVADLSNTVATATISIKRSSCLPAWKMKLSGRTARMSYGHLLKVVYSSSIDATLLEVYI